MDKGAARSRKRERQLERAAEAGHPAPSDVRLNPKRGPNGDVHVKHPAGAGSAAKRPRVRPEPVRPQKRERQLLDESIRYRPKAIRSSAALVWSEGAFPLPPPKDILDGARRIDLAGSGVTDVSWLKGSKATWLSLAGCTISQGWDAIGSLEELSVLNVSHCSLKSLPAELGRLSNLKALVAMGNDWSDLPEDTVSGWKQLNSLIVSHSLNLTSLPVSLSHLYQMSKLTFSHCPKLVGASIPDLSTLPLLRDVKMNNLPHLTSLPSHISTWGKGYLALARQARPRPGVEVQSETQPSARRGNGLEVLDLGNCSLPYSAVEGVFLAAPKASAGTKAASVSAWPHLRSLTLHSNPLATTHPNYPDLLQASPQLPNLQIIDAKRVRERKRKGEISQGKAANRVQQRKVKPTGANDAIVVEKRKWGADERAPADESEGPEGRSLASSSPNDATSDRKRRRKDADNGTSQTDEARALAKKAKKSKAGGPAPSSDRVKSKGAVSQLAPPAALRDANIKGVPDPVDTSLDPSASAPSHKPTRATDTYKYQVVEVQRSVTQGTAATAEKEAMTKKKAKKDKGRKDTGKVVPADAESGSGSGPAVAVPVDLKAMFGSGPTTADDNDAGLGLGGW